MGLFALLLALLGSSPALAEPMSPRTQVLLGAGLAGGATVTHALVHGVRCPDCGVHLVPVVGPVVALREVASTPCNDSRHGCLRAVSYAFYGEMALLQAGGIVAIASGALRKAPDETASHLRFGVGANRVLVGGRW